MTSTDTLTKIILEAGTLRKISRSHKQELFTNDESDNIASHSYRVVLIAYLLAKEEKVNVEKVLTMATFHDFSETRSGDQNWINKRYVKVFEDQIAEEQLKDISKGELLEIMKEYDERKTKESKIAKDADLLDQIFLLREYEHTGNKEAKLWLKDNAQQKMLFSKTAKEIAKKALKEDLNSWWVDLWTSKRR